MKEITKIKICNNLILIFFYNKIIPILNLLAKECSTYSLNRNIINYFGVNQNYLSFENTW